LLSTNSLGFEAERLSNNNVNTLVLKEIEEIEDKILVIDKIICDRHVRYWQHIIDGVLVKNDSILLHLDPETGDVLQYKTKWTDVKLGSLDFREDIFEQDDILLQKKVVFPDKNDSGLFYNFYSPQSYPVVCWEVRYADGRIILYDSLGNEIGYGASVPAKGCAITGYGDQLWNFWRDNAKEWFDKWCDDVYIEMWPSLIAISYIIRKPNVQYFYVIAHSGGLPTQFSAHHEGVYYTASRLHDDMLWRNPMKLAVLCCCSAMVDTGPGTLSYEFRKGQMEDTVTIGYFNMGNCPGWPYDVYDWQDFMFEKMDDSDSYTMKQAFDLACAQYPSVADYVRFVGDENINIRTAITPVNQIEENFIENEGETGCQYSDTSQVVEQSEYMANTCNTADLINTRLK